MVGIAQFYLAANILQILCAQCALNSTLGAYIHKYRGLHCAVGAGKFAPTGFALSF